MDQRKSTLNIALEVIDEGINRLARQLHVKGVALTEFESNGVASAHTRKLLRENLPDAERVT